MELAFTFPGQGSQVVGMGRDLANAFPVARTVFEEVDDALDERLSDVIFEGPEETLKLTANAQPALMAVSMAVVRVAEERGVNVTQAKYVAGHSLGEYSALCAAGALSITDAACLLRLRGNAMQAAVAPGEGAMAALIGASLEEAEAIAAEAAAGDVCEVANDNAPGQVVISGTAVAVDRAITIAKGRGVKRAVLLPVSAPFHCSLMQPAADAMAQALADVTFATPSVPVITNVTAGPVSDPQALRSGLVDQVTGRVRWTESVQKLSALGVTDLAELGSGKVLSGLARRIDKSLGAHAIGAPADIDTLAELIAG